MIKLAANDPDFDSYLRCLRKLTDSEQKFLAHWEADKDLDAWAAFLGKNPRPWKTETHWDPPRKNRVLHPSSISNPCDMFLFCQLQGMPENKNIPGSRHKIFSIGTALHIMMDYYQGTRAKEMDYGYQAEVPLCQEPGLPIFGTADAITTGWPLKKCPVLWEYKSISASSLNRMSSIPPAYVTQATTYMACHNIPVCIILFINKENGGFYPRTLFLDENLWKSIYDRAKYIAGCDADNMPKRNVSSQCRQCVYRDVCDPPI